MPRCSPRGTKLSDPWTAIKLRMPHARIATSSNAPLIPYCVEHCWNWLMHNSFFPKTHLSGCLRDFPMERKHGGTPASSLGPSARGVVGQIHCSPFSHRHLGRKRWNLVDMTSYHPTILPSYLLPSEGGRVTRLVELTRKYSQNCN